MVNTQQQNTRAERQAAADAANAAANRSFNEATARGGDTKAINALASQGVNVVTVREGVYDRTYIGDDITKNDVLNPNRGAYIDSAGNYQNHYSIIAEKTRIAETKAALAAQTNNEQQKQSAQIAKQDAQTEAAKLAQRSEVQRVAKENIAMRNEQKKMLAELKSDGAKNVIITKPNNSQIIVPVDSAYKEVVRAPAGSVITADVAKSQIIQSSMIELGKNEKITGAAGSIASPIFFVENKTITDKSQNVPRPPKTEPLEQVQQDIKNYKTDNPVLQFGKGVAKGAVNIAALVVNVERDAGDFFTGQKTTNRISINETVPDRVIGGVVSGGVETIKTGSPQAFAQEAGKEFDLAQKQTKEQPLAETIGELAFFGGTAAIPIGGVGKIGLTTGAKVAGKQVAKESAEQGAKQTAKQTAMQGSKAFPARGLRNQGFEDLPKLEKGFAAPEEKAIKNSFKISEPAVKDIATTGRVPRVPNTSALDDAAQISKLEKTRLDAGKKSPVELDPNYKPTLPKSRAQDIGTYKIQQSEIFKADTTAPKMPFGKKPSVSEGSPAKSSPMQIAKDLPLITQMQNKITPAALANARTAEKIRAAEIRNMPYTSTPISLGKGVGRLVPTDNAGSGAGISKSRPPAPPSDTGANDKIISTKGGSLVMQTKQMAKQIAKPRADYIKLGSGKAMTVKKTKSTAKQISLGTGIGKIVSGKQQTKQTARVSLGLGQGFFTKQKSSPILGSKYMTGQTQKQKQPSRNILVQTQPQLFAQTQPNIFKEKQSQTYKQTQPQIYRTRTTFKLDTPQKTTPKFDTPQTLTPTFKFPPTTRPPTTRVPPTRTPPKPPVLPIPSGGGMFGSRRGRGKGSKTFKWSVYNPLAPSHSISEGKKGRRKE